jgi:hypothetical protein
MGCLAAPHHSGRMPAAENTTQHFRKSGRYTGVTNSGWRAAAKSTKARI